MTDDPADLARFLRGDLDPAAFTHRKHLRMAFEMLRRHAFLDAARLYCRALRVLAAKAGQPGKFHLTVTLAFLSLVAERMPGQDEFDAFLEANPELLDTSVLNRLYDPDRLCSEAARETFLLPLPLTGAAPLRRVR